MRWCRFRKDHRTGFGIIDDRDEVAVIEGSPFDNYRVTGETHGLGAVKLLPPVVPPTFYAAGVNYREHVAHAAALRGEEPALPRKPDVGYRAVNALVGQGDAIVIPADASEQVQYEGELVAVIGRKWRKSGRCERYSPSSPTTTGSAGSSSSARSACTMPRNRRQ